MRTDTLTIRDVVCDGACRHTSAEECTDATHLVFPYRGVYVRHLGRSDAVAEANQVLFFNKAEGYRVSHPISGGDASLDLRMDDAAVRELAPKGLVRQGGTVAFQQHRLRIDPRTQALVALLRHSLEPQRRGDTGSGNARLDPGTARARANGHRMRPAPAPAAASWSTVPSSCCRRT